MESLNSVYRRLNNQRSIFTSDIALLLCIYQQLKQLKNELQH